MSQWQHTLKIVVLLSFVACTTVPPVSTPSTATPSSAQWGAVLLAKNVLSAAQAHITPQSDGDLLSIKIYINQENRGFKTQNLELNKIAKLKGWVKGNGIANQIWNINGFIQVTGGATNLQISGIPKGPNRVVSVQGYDAADNPIPGALLKAIYSSPSSGNQVTVTLTWYSTATAQILEHMVENNAPLASTLDVNNLQSALDNILYNGTTHIKPANPGQTYSEFVLHPKWLDPSAMAMAIAGNGGILPPGAAPSGWLLPKATPNPTVFVRTAENVNFKSAITVQISDPASAPAAIAATNDSVTMADIVAGNWQIIATLAGLNGGVSGRANLTVNQDGTTAFAAGTTGNPLKLPPVITQMNGTAATDNDQGIIGSTLSLAGDGFNIANQVTNNSVDFGGTAGTITGGNGLGTQINVMVPPTIFGVVKVSVTTGTLKGNEADFKVVPTLANFAPVAATEGSAVTLTGTGFDPTPANNTVTFNGITATVTAATNTALTVTVPTGATTGKISVTTSGGTVQSTPNFIVNNANAPAIVNFTPTNATMSLPSTATVTINGTNFDPTPGNNTVKFNGVTATVNAASTTALTVTVPLLATTGKITVETANGLVASATDFTVNSSVYTVAGTAGFSAPHGIGIDGNGNLFVADSGNHKIIKLTPQPDGTYLSAVYAGTGTAGAADGDRLTAAQFRSPEDVVIDTNGDLYIADTNNAAIRKITAATGIVSTIANTGHGLKAPEGLDIGLDGNVYFTDNVTTCTLFIFGVCVSQTLNNARVYRVAKDGLSAPVVFAGNTAGDAPGVGTAALFRHLEGLVINQTTGDIYLADTGNHKIKRITVPGALVTDYVTPPAGFTMHEIGIDNAGHVYIPGESKQLIYKVNATTQVISTLAGTATAGFSDGLASTAQFNSPRDAAIDNQGNVYIADTSNRRIRKITP